MMYVLSKNIINIKIVFLVKHFNFITEKKKSLYIAWACFRNENQGRGKCRPNNKDAVTAFLKTCTIKESLFKSENRFKCLKPVKMPYCGSEQKAWFC